MAHWIEMLINTNMAGTMSPVGARIELSLMRIDYGIPIIILLYGALNQILNVSCSHLLHFIAYVSLLSLKL